MTNLIPGYVPDGWTRGDALFFEGGLNCGIHSVSRDGLLLGPRGTPPANEVAAYCSGTRMFRRCGNG